MRKTVLKYVVSALAALMLSALAPFAAAAEEAPAEAAIYITDASGFALLREFPDGDFVLAADVVLGDGFVPIESFYGSLDGGGFSVSLAASGEHPDGFALIKENHGSLTRLTLTCDISVTAADDAYIGGAAAKNYGEISDCAVYGTVRVEMTSESASEYVYAGGLVGYSEGVISDCASHAEISLRGTGMMHAGGIAGGIFDTVLINSESSARVYAEGSTAEAGGLVGECDGKTGYSSFSGTVTAVAVSKNGKNSYAYAGGIAGYSLDSSAQCANVGTVTAKGDSLSSAYAGGCCGILYGRVSRFENGGAISASANLSAYAGGVAGRVSDGVSDSKNTAGVTASGRGEAYAGGVAGRSPSCESCVSDCEIAVTAKTACVGGICGDSDLIKNCASSGVVAVETAAEALVGGICGNARTVSGCVSSCVINVGGGFCEIFVGGVTAKAYANVTGSSFSGGVTVETAGGYIYAGGVIAYNTAAVSDCEASPSITVRMETADASGVVAAGCIAGGNYGGISDCRGTAKIYAHATLKTSVRGSGRKISVFAGNNAGLSRVGGIVENSTAKSVISAYIISGGVTKPKLNLD